MAKTKKKVPKTEWNYKENRATPVAPRSAAPDPSMIYDYELNRARPRTSDDAYAQPPAQGPISQDPKIRRGMAETDRTLAQWNQENDRRDRELVNRQFTLPQFHGANYAAPLDGATMSRLADMSQPVSNGAAEFDPQSPRMANLFAAQGRNGNRAPKVPVSQQTAPPLLPQPTYSPSGTSTANAERTARLKARGMDDNAIERMIYPERFADLRATAQQQVARRGLVMGRPKRSGGGGPDIMAGE